MKVMAALAGLALIVAVASPYRRARLLSFIDPSAHSSGSGYQVMQSLIGLGSGHLVGAGLGGGQAQWGYLPNAHTDFIFSVIGEQLGIVGRLPRAVPARRVRMARHPGRGAVAGPVRRVALPRARGVGGGRDADQRRGRGRRAARHGDPAPVHLLRWLVARDHHGGGGRADQRRPPGRGPGGRCGGGVDPAGSAGAAEVGERTARHGDRGWRDGRPRGPLAADRPRAGRPRARGGVDRALRLPPGARGGHLADAGVPLHAPPRPWAAPQHASRRLVGQCGGGHGTGLGLPARPRLLPAPEAPDRGHRRRLRELPGRGGRRAHEGAARLHEHRRRPGRSEPSAGSLRRRECGGLRRDGPPTGPRHRHPGMARARRARTGPPPAGPRAGSRSGLPPDRQTVSCAGGSLGARRVNRAVADLAGMWAACADRTLYHVTGRRDYDSFAPGAAADSDEEGRRSAVTGWSPSRTGCPTSTTRPTCASSAPAP